MQADCSDELDDEESQRGRLAEDVARAARERNTSDDCPVACAAVSPAGRTAAEQLEHLWATLLAEQTPLGVPVAWPSLRSVQQEAMQRQTYANLLASREDLQPHCWKNLCSVGMVARAEIKWHGGGGGGAAHRWTGLFSGDSSGEGILRLSTAIACPTADESRLPGTLRLALRMMAGDLAHATLFPCVAFKVPRSNWPSGNLCFAGRKVGQASPSFFVSPLATHLTEKASPILRPLLNVFRKHTAYPTHLGLSDFAKATGDGEISGDPRFPWALVLVPTAEAAQKSIDSSNTSEAFLQQLADIPVGTALYDIYAVPHPNAGAHSSKHDDSIPRSENLLVFSGRLVTRSRFIRSAADHNLKFWHQAKEDDYALRPDWEATLTRGHLTDFSAEHYAKIVGEGTAGVAWPARESVACGIQATPNVLAKEGTSSLCLPGDR